MISIIFVIALGLTGCSAAVAAQEKVSSLSFAAHDLQDIHQAAELFLKRHQKQGENFSVAPTNPKVIVEHCLVPLESSWAKADNGKNRQSIRITCRHAAGNSQGWRVVLPVTPAQKEK